MTPGVSLIDPRGGYAHLPEAEKRGLALSRIKIRKAAVLLFVSLLLRDGLYIRKRLANRRDGDQNQRKQRFQTDISAVVRE